jgi:hypothetical protein
VRDKQLTDSLILAGCPRTNPMMVNSSSSSGKYATSFAHYLLQHLARRVAIDKLVKAVQESDLIATIQKKSQDENDNA